ncbi:MAG: DUF4105 domain-containing protein [Longimicrobiales bacterium]|nr:DUF4105 domain-containing protein [Longimicrobiales bacterium]
MNAPVLRHGLIALSLVIFLLAPANAAGQEAEPGSDLRVWLVTAGPGDAVWERYGHNALRVLDTRTGYDVSYNWGIFSFGQPVEFIVRFLQGRMLYMMAPFDTRAMLGAYAQANREVVLQELALTPAERLELQAFAENNAQPENRDYFYQYFLDNCSTRVRDLLDLVLGGRLEEGFGEVHTHTSYRWHTRRLTQVDPLIYAGMDALLGAPTDVELTVWEEMFLPLTLRDAIRDFDVVRADGSVGPLVLSEEIAVPSTRPAEELSPPRWLWQFLFVGLFLGAVFGSLALPAVRTSTIGRRIVYGIAAAWSGLFGLLGLILTGLLFTDHVFSTWNENLFLANPLLLLVAVSLPLSNLDPVWSRRALTVSWVCTTLALVGLLWQLAPLSGHQNGMFFALLLPGHLGLGWGLRSVVGDAIT